MIRVNTALLISVLLSVFAPLLAAEASVQTRTEKDLLGEKQAP